MSKDPTIDKIICCFRTGADLEEFHEIAYVDDLRGVLRGYSRFSETIDADGTINRTAKYIGKNKADVINYLYSLPPGTVLWVPDRRRRRGDFVAKEFGLPPFRQGRVILHERNTSQ